MSGSEDQVGYEDAEEPYAEEPEAGPAPASEHRLRRGLFGYRRADVRAELEAQAVEIDEMRDELAALWLAFNQHERTIRDLIGAVRQVGGGEVAPPGDRTVNDLYTDPNEASTRSDAWVADQLEGLDEVLGAIKQATELLERGYEGQLPPPAGEVVPRNGAASQPAPRSRPAPPDPARLPLPPSPQPPPSGPQPRQRDAAATGR